MWQQIVSELFAVSRETLITVGTEPEALLIRDWGADLGRDVTVTENPADPIYDLWVSPVESGLNRAEKKRIFYSHSNGGDWIRLSRSLTAMPLPGRESNGGVHDRIPRCCENRISAFRFSALSVRVR